MGLILAQPHQTEEYGNTAALLLAMAEEQGLHPRVVETVLGGFLVPDSISDLLKAAPPEGWDEPLQKPDVEYIDGKYYITADGIDESDPIQESMEDEFVTPGEAASDEVTPEEAAEGNVPLDVIRQWAKENGHPVADKGRIKQSVVEAFYAAHNE